MRRVGSSVKHGSSTGGGLELIIITFWCWFVLSGGGVICLFAVGARSSFYLCVSWQRIKNVSRFKNVLI